LERRRQTLLRIFQEAVQLFLDKGNMHAHKCISRGMHMGHSSSALKATLMLRKGWRLVDLRLCKYNEQNLFTKALCALTQLNETALKNFIPSPQCVYSTREVDFQELIKNRIDANRQVHSVSSEKRVERAPASCTRVNHFPRHAKSAF
jgi:hypothetical protein